MIVLSRLDGKELVVNAEHILTVESMPDTMLLLSGGHRLVVRESVDEVVERVVEYRRRISTTPEVLANVVPFPGPEGRG